MKAQSLCGPRASQAEILASRPRGNRRCVRRRSPEALRSMLLPLSPRRRRLLARWGLAAAALLAVALAVHRVHFTWTHSANVLFWDQWDIYEPLFRDEGAWERFNRQHGPHRQGLGSLVTGAIAPLTGWDVRYDALLSVGAMVLACAAGVMLARKCGVSTALSLAVVPLLGLTMRQFELWVGPANPAHSPLPVLLLLLYALAWFASSPGRRLALQVPLVVLMLFTGFGLFAAAVATGLLLLDGVLLLRDREWRGALGAVSALAVVSAGWWLFFRGYVWDPADPSFRFPHERPLEYAGFAALMFAGYAGFKAVNSLVPALPLGAALLAALCWVGWKSGRRSLGAPLDRRPADAVVLFLVLATLLFCVNTAVGRIGMGWRAAPYPSRYVALLFPGLLALFIAAQAQPHAWRRWGATGVLAFVAAWNGLLPGREIERISADFRQCRLVWRDTYLATGDKAAADAASARVNGFAIHPGPLTEKLEFLRERRLNFFAGAAESASSPQR